MSLDFKEDNLIDLCELVTDGSHHSPPSQVEGYYMASVKDMGAYKFIYSDCRKISEEDYDKLVKSGCSPKNEDILIAKDGSPLSNIFIYQEEYPMVLLSSIAIIRANKNKILPEFLKYYLENPSIKKYIQTTYTSGSVIPRIILKDFKKFPINYPDIANQKKIIGVLKSIDEKIAINEEINKNLEGLAKSIYRYHFIDFKPYSQDNFKSTTIGEIPENWSVQSIEDFVDDMKNGGTPKRGESDYWKNGTVPWLKTGEINNNIIIKSEEHITKLGLKNSSAKLLPVNSIIMALYGTGTAARIGLLKLEATTNQACCAMICNDFNKTLFLYLFLLFNQKEIENLASGSVQQNLSKDLIANLKLVVPPIEIIDNLPFKEIFDTIANNYFEIEYLTNLRDTLLPKLMSGEMDISKINCDLKIIIIKFILNPLKYLWRYLNENKDYIQNTKSNETLLKSRPIYKINKFFTKFTSRYRNYRQ